MSQNGPKCLLNVSKGVKLARARGSIKEDGCMIALKAADCV